MKTPIKKTRSSWFLLLIILPLGLYFWFGLQHLTEFDTADEHLWISNLYTGRIQQYWDAVRQKDWPKTRINDKPGITLALISGIGMNFETKVKAKIVERENLWIRYNPEKMRETFFIYRLPIVIFNGLMSLFFLWALWRLTKKHWLALAVSSFILLSPILTGISQIINPDSLLWVFSFASLLSFILFLKKNLAFDGILTALLFGLALLSKYVALIFIPFFLVALLYYLFFYYSELEANKIFRKKAIILPLGYLLIVAGGIGFFALGMPAVLVKPGIIYKLITEFADIQKIAIVCASVSIFIFLDAVILKSATLKFLFTRLKILKTYLPKILYLSLIALVAATIANWSFGNNFLHTPFFEVDGGRRSLLAVLPFHQQMALQAKPLVFSLPPIVLLLLFYIWIKSVFRKSEFDYFVFIFSIFLPVFFFAVTRQSLLVHVRYSVVLYPFALALAGIGFYEIVKDMKQRYAVLLFLAVLLAGVYNIWTVKPFYFNYANDFLPKNSLISTSWGYGGYEAVSYINSVSGKDPLDVKIWTNYFGVCPFFAGKCVPEGSVKWMKKDNINEIDYVVINADGMERNKSGLKKINAIFPTDTPEWEINIGGRPGNSIRVYKNTNK